MTAINISIRDYSFITGKSICSLKHYVTCFSLFLIYIYNLQPSWLITNVHILMLFSVFVTYVHRRDTSFLGNKHLYIV